MAKERKLSAELEALDIYHDKDELVKKARELFNIFQYKCGYGYFTSKKFASKYCDAMGIVEKRPNYWGLVKFYLNSTSYGE